MLKKLEAMKNEQEYTHISENRYQYNGVNVPRVTQILSSMLFDERLMYWSNSLGFKHKRYKDQLDMAAYIGTKAHDGVENIIKDTYHSYEMGNKYITPINNAISGFRQWWDGLNSNCNVEVIGIEEKLSSPWFGGTYDILLKINGKVYLIDLKTSNHIDSKYFMQLSAYKYMIENSKNIILHGCIILQLDKKIPTYTEYFLDFTNPKHKLFIDKCTEEFFTLVYGYWNKLYIDKMFKDIFKNS